jgi:hypothetical protein
MTLSNKQIFELMQNSDDFTTQLVLTIDALADQVKKPTRPARKARST